MATDTGYVPSRAPEAHISMGICMGLSVVFIIARCAIRIFHMKQWGMQDYMLLLGWIFITAHNILSFTIMGRNGVIGIHIWDVRPSSLTIGYAKRELAGQLCYTLAALFIKLSLFSFYLELFHVKVAVRYWIYAGAITCIIFYVATLILYCWLLIPSPGVWSTAAGWLSRQAATDADTQRLIVAQGVFGTISDIYLLLIPLHCISHLHLPNRKKWRIAIVFVAGLAAIACSVTSLVYRVESLASTDETWIGIVIYILSDAEISAGIIACCLPVCAALPQVIQARYRNYLLAKSLASSDRQDSEIEASRTSQSS